MKEKVRKGRNKENRWGKKSKNSGKNFLTTKYKFPD